VAVIRVIADACVSGCKMAGGRNIDSKFRDSHITGKYASSEDGATKVNTLMLPHRKLSKPMQQTRVSVVLVTTAAAKYDMRSIVIIIELLYRIVIAITFIYRIVYLSKTVFNIS